MLRATAAAGHGFVKWTVSGVDTAPGQTDLRVDAQAGETKVVRAIFALGGTGGGNDDGGASNNDASAEAGPARQCGASNCAVGQKCCLSTDIDRVLACKDACARDDVEATCSTADACGAGKKCCLRLDYSSGAKAKSLACEDADDCDGEASPLCAPDATQPCGSGGSMCGEFGESLHACFQPF